MAAIPGVRLDITGASGSQGLLAPKSSYRVYVFPRGGHASQDSTGTLITFDSASVASRFAADDWIQVGTATANIRKVSAVGGNSLSVQGSAVTVTENDRVFLIGSTQPTTSGGSTTYLTPRSFIFQRGDDGADRFTNSMVTTDSNGGAAFWSAPAVYDTLIQDGNGSPVGMIADLPVGLAEGVSTTSHAFFGATVTVNAGVSFNQWAHFGSSVTMHAALGVTGTAAIGSTLTAHANVGITGTLLVGATATVNGALGVTGWLVAGTSTTVHGALGVTGVITGATTISSGQYLKGQRLSFANGTAISVNGFSLSAGWGATATRALNGAAYDSAGELQIVPNGAITANPYVVFTFTDGAFGGNLTFSPMFLGTRTEMSAPTTAWWITSHAGLNSATFIFAGTPVAGSSYSLAYVGFAMH